jgi:hypothetical protein
MNNFQLAPVTILIRPQHYFGQISEEWNRFCRHRKEFVRQILLQGVTIPGAMDALWYMDEKEGRTRQEVSGRT